MRPSIPMCFVVGSERYSVLRWPGSSAEDHQQTRILITLHTSARTHTHIYDGHLAHTLFMVYTPVIIIFFFILFIALASVSVFWFDESSRNTNVVYIYDNIK